MMPVVPVFGIFSNGTDLFQGTTLDTQTWATSTANTGTAFQQSNALTIHAFRSGPPYPFGGYTTTSPLVGVGGSAWAQVRVINAETQSSTTFAELALDTDPHGVNAFLFDSIELELSAQYFQTSAFQGVYGGEGQTSGGTETGYGPTAVLTPSELPFGATYIFQIERLSSSSARFSLFTETGAAPDGGIQIALVGSGLQGFVTTSANMYLSLQAVGSDTTFLSATVNHPIALNQTEVFVPEPASVAGLGLCVVSACRWRLRKSNGRAVAVSSVP
jgi:hypothetical protein